MAKSKKGLGKSFESLIPTEDSSYDPTFGTENQSAHTRPLKIQDIKPNPDQPRKTFGKEAMEDLKSSIETHGLMQPIIVVRDGADYRLVAGERRWRASKELGHDTIPAIVRTLDEQQKIEMSLIENLQREDLNPLEVADTLMKLMDQFSVTAEQLSKRVGKAAPTIHNTVRLLKLPGPAKKALEKGKISEGHARAILMLDGDPRKQQALLDYVLKHKWSVRQAEQFAAVSKDKPTKSGIKNTLETNEDTKKLSKKLGTTTPVKIFNMAKGRGRIIIEFKDKEEYKKVSKKLID